MVGRIKLFVSIADDSLFCALSCFVWKNSKIGPTEVFTFWPGATIQGNVAKTGKFVNNYNNASFGSDYSHIHNSATLFTINTSDSPSV